eukprot:6812561-Lingulodinium_polyedra.AAC.1
MRHHAGRLRRSFHRQRRARRVAPRAATARPGTGGDPKYSAGGAGRRPGRPGLGLRRVPCRGGGLAAHRGPQ